MAPTYEQNFRARLKMRHGWTPEGYQEVFDAQGGVCVICDRAEMVPDPRSGRLRKLSIDHDHRCCAQNRSCSRCRRGLICMGCNQGLGKFADSPQLLREAADYLELYAIV